MKDNIIYNKSFEFSIKIVKLYEKLSNEKKEYVLSKQLLKSGTSIGANVREGLDAQSKKDFVSKISIALKEACETEYWIELLVATEYIDKHNSKKLLSDLEEIIKILTAILKTTKKNIKEKITD